MIKSRHAILALLTALNLLNYLDRYVVNAVGPKIQESLSLSDGQIGWVGSVFMLGYFLTSPLFGWLGDRYPRKWLIAAGVAIWSVATAVSGLAGMFVSMLVARVAVGVGEASYATLSPTIIDDISEAKSKNRWLAIFYVAIPVGSAFGFLLGGWIQRFYGWRTAFFIAGGPGIVLAFAALLIVEPARAVAPPGRDGTEGAPSGYAALASSPLYVAAVVGYVAQTFALGGFAFWAPHFLERKHCLDLAVGDSWFGVITAVTGLVGTGLGGWLADRWPGENRARAALRVCAISSLVAAPLAFAAVWMPSGVGFLVALGACELAVFTSVAPTNAAILLSVPPALRAKAMAASIFAIHLLGDLISPPLIGAISGVFGDRKTVCSGGVGLQAGLYLLPLALALSAVAWWRGSAAPSPAPAAAPHSPR